MGASADPATWLAMAYLVVFGSIALFGLYLFALRRWTASAVSYTTLLMPLVTLPVAAVLISEPIPWRSWQAQPWRYSASTSGPSCRGGPHVRP